MSGPPDPNLVRAERTDAELAAIAGYFKLLAEPLRLRLLDALRAGERSVNQLMAATGGNQANVSKHLKALLDAGLVSRRKEGTSAFYAVADPLVFALCRAVAERQAEGRGVRP